MSAARTGTRTSRYRTNVALYVVTVLAACAAGLGLFLVVQERDDRQQAESAGSVPAAQAEAYEEVLEAATRQATAFVNIDHTDPEKSIEAVRAGATGTFRKQYDAAVDGLRELLVREKSVMTGEVLSAGIVAADTDSATVLVATKGHVQNTQTKGEKQERNLRLQLALTRVDGKWLTSDLQFVG